MGIGASSQQVRRQGVEDGDQHADTGHQRGKEEDLLEATDDGAPLVQPETPGTQGMKPGGEDTEEKQSPNRDRAARGTNRESRGDGPRLQTQGGRDVQRHQPGRRIQ